MQEHPDYNVYGMSVVITGERDYGDCQPQTWHMAPKLFAP